MSKKFPVLDLYPKNKNQKNIQIKPVPNITNIFRKKRVESFYTNPVCMKYRIKSDHEKWHKFYRKHIIQMYKICTRNINSNFGREKIKFRNNEKIIANFSRLLFSSSSGYIEK